MSVLLPRRRLLRGAGAAVALPLLEAMWPAPARAATAGLLSAKFANRPKRFITFFVPNGTLKALWWPATPAEQGFELAPLMKPLEAHKQDLIILQGLDNRATASGLRCTHNDASTLTTGWGLIGPTISSAVAGGISIDQAIAQRIDEATPLRSTSVQIGNASGTQSTRLSQLGRGRPLPNVSQPAQLFARLFADPRLDQAALDRQWARRKSVLDDVKADLQSVIPRVSADDRKRLEAHLDSVRVVERRVALVTGCRPPDPMYPTYDLYGDTLPAASRAFIDTLALAMSCDLTRVATLMFRPAGGGSSYFSFLGLSKVYAEGEHHELTHTPNDPPRRERLITIYTWFSQTLAYLVDKLKQTPDGTGTLFDTSLVLQVSECSDGATHSKTNMPFLMLGSLGGTFRTGRQLSYPKVSHNDLLLSILQAFGSNETTFGDPKLCNGPLAGLT